MSGWMYCYERQHQLIDGYEMFLKPSEIFFSQDTIAWSFQNGGYLEDAVTHLLNGSLSVEDFPAIQVVKFVDGKYYSLDNRRLYVFRVGQYYGVVAKVPVQVLDLQPRHLKKFTTRNGGTEISLRQGETQVNWKDSWVATATLPQRIMSQGQLTAHSLNRGSASSTHLSVATRYSTPNEDASLTSAFKALNINQANKDQASVMLSPEVKQDRHVAFGLNAISNNNFSSRTVLQPLTEQQKLTLVRLELFLRG